MTRIYNTCRDDVSDTSFQVRFFAQLQRMPNGCLEWTGREFSHHYGAVRVPLRQGRDFLVHRVAWEIAYGPIPDGLLVLHRCDNPPCCDPEHLFLGTDADNAADCLAKGRHRAGHLDGELSWSAKLKNQDVLDIRARYASGETQVRLAKAFGVSQPTISEIVMRKNWKHLPEASCQS